LSEKGLTTIKKVSLGEKFVNAMHHFLPGWKGGARPAIFFAP
jgi:hypothetical protein